METTIDIAAQRALTPGCANVNHLNHAGASLMTQATLDAQIDHLRLEASIGGYEAARAARERIEAVYDSAARLIGATRDEIGMVENATVAWQHAFYALTRKAEAGQRILTSRSDYGGNIVAFLQRSRELGLTVEVVDNDAHGAVDAAALQATLGDDVALVAISHVPTNGGVVNPAEAIGEACAAAGVPYLLDACQSAGQIALDVSALRCDALTATSRKYLRGPRGAGFIYMSQARLDAGIDPIVLDHHSASLRDETSYTLRPDARRFENWEFNYGSVLGLGAAIDHALDLGLERIEPQVTAIAASTREALGAIEGVTVRDLGERRCGICTFTVDGVASKDVQAALEQAHINVSVTSLDGAMYDTARRSLPTMVRASVHYLTTDDEIDALCGHVEAIVSSR